MNSTNAVFEPRWASPPSRTIESRLEELGERSSSLSELLQVDGRTARALLTNSIELSDDLAERLARSLGASPSFWLNRFQQYQLDLERVEADQWARRAPSELFGALGWVRSSTDWKSRIENLLEFFDLPDFSSWKDQYDPVIAQVKYRKHSSADTNDVAVAAWLKRAQNMASEIEVEHFDGNILSSSVDAMRQLSRKKDPAEFLPELQGLCARAGVALVVIPSPKGCPISGARYRTATGSPMIVLSGRYLADDHLWFTFFHEVAHILLHSSEMSFVDRLDQGGSDESESRFEREADAWAGAVIAEEALLARVNGKRITRRLIALIALEAKVPSGLIVGQLQHRRSIDFDRFNHLKRRYRWNGPSLELRR